jgi:hypothetical protein
VRASFVCSAAVVALLLAGEARAADYGGPEFVRVTGQSLNVLAMHQQVALAQLVLDDTFPYFELTTRAMPATFVLSDGQRTDGGLARVGFGFGAGVGQPSEVAAFASLQMDLAGVVEFPAILVPHSQIAASTGQVVATAGVAVRGWQLSGGVFVDGGFQGLDAQGRIPAPGTLTPSFRQGTPRDVVARGEAPEGRDKVQPMFVLSSAAGFSSGASLGRELGDAGGAYLAALRSQLAPAALMDRLDLREAGVPLLGLDVLDAGEDYWGEQNPWTVDTARPDDIPEYAAPNAGPDTWQTSAGWDDIGGTGLRLRAVTQLAPTPLFRMGEAAWLGRFDVGGDGALVAGGRGAVFRRVDRHEACGDAFLAVGRVGDRPGRQAWVTASWSYNSPDSTTFFPIPRAHVLGVQFARGPVEATRPLLPIIPEVE